MSFFPNYPSNPWANQQQWHLPGPSSFQSPTLRLSSDEIDRIGGLQIPSGFGEPRRYGPDPYQEYLQILQGIANEEANVPEFVAPEPLRPALSNRDLLPGLLSVGLGLLAGRGQGAVEAATGYLGGRANAYARENEYAQQKAAQEFQNRLARHQASLASKKTMADIALSKYQQGRQEKLEADQALFQKREAYWDRLMGEKDPEEVIRLADEAGSLFEGDPRQPMIAKGRKNAAQSILEKNELEALHKEIATYNNDLYNRISEIDKNRKEKLLKPKSITWGIPIFPTTFEAQSEFPWYSEMKIFKKRYEALLEKLMKISPERRFDFVPLPVPDKPDAAAFKKMISAQGPEYISKSKLKSDLLPPAMQYGGE